MTEHVIDMAAVGRISQRVDLQEIRLIEIHATTKPGATAVGPLRPSFNHDCTAIKAEAGVIEVACSYDFKVYAAESELAEAHIKYHVIYKLLGEEPTAASDIEHFARANGAYHSWPFVRESIYSLTGRMGFPPYTLPVLSFLRPKPAETTSAPVAEPAKASAATR